MYGFPVWRIQCVSFLHFKHVHKRNLHTWNYFSVYFAVGGLYWGKWSCINEFNHWGKENKGYFFNDRYRFYAISTFNFFTTDGRAFLKIKSRQKYMQYRLSPNTHTYTFMNLNYYCSDCVKWRFLFELHVIQVGFLKYHD